MIPCIIESPFAGCVPLHVAYANAAVRTCLREGFTPYASHLMLTRALDDNDPDEREFGIRAGIVMRDALLASRTDAHALFFVDLGWSRGMRASRESLPTMPRLQTWQISEEEWLRVGLDACVNARFRRCVREAAQGSDNREGLLAARELWLARYDPFVEAVQ